MTDDIDYGELFGIDAGGNEQEVAEPAEDETEGTQGGEEQEVAEPAADDAEQSTTGDAGDGEPDTGGEVEEQSPEERAKYAAARRKAEAERDAAIAKVREEERAKAKQELDEAFASAGLTNPYTKQPIKTKADYDAYRQQLEEEKKAKVLRKAGMTDTEFDEFVQNLPVVREAKQAQQQAEAAVRQAQQQQAQVQIDEELKQITALDPAIKTMQDLTKMENYPQFYALVKKGNNLVDAFKLANFDSLKGSAAAAAKQAAINSVQSKRHLDRTTTRGAGAVTVPADVKEMYKIFNPDATDAEIQAHYQKTHKK